MSAARGSITLVRRIKAPPMKLYEAWTDPAKLARWWGPRIVETTVLAAEARVGGCYHILMREPGGRTHDLRGVYRDLVPGERLVFTWGFVGASEEESIITVTLRAVEDGTELTLTHEGPGDSIAFASRDEGWTRSLNRLERVFG